MYTFFSKLSKSDLFVEQLPLFAFSFVISEMFYKFGSFSLECLAFLATWFATDLVLQTLKFLFRSQYSHSTIK